MAEAEQLQCSETLNISGVFSLLLPANTEDFPGPATLLECIHLKKKNTHTLNLKLLFRGEKSSEQ